MTQLLYLCFVAVDVCVAVLILARRSNYLDPLRRLFLVVASFVGSVVGLIVSTLLTSVPEPISYVLDFLMSFVLGIGLLLVLLRTNTPGESQ